MLGRITRLAWLALIAGEKDLNAIGKSRKSLKRGGFKGRDSENYVPRLTKAPRQKQAKNEQR
jgi:hypothetical protein